MKAPRSLNKTGRQLWKALIADYAFSDSASLELLTRACMASDRAQQAREAIENNGGPVTKDRFGVPIRHPACVLERDSTATMIACFKLLGLHEPRDAKAAGRRFGS